MKHMPDRHTVRLTYFKLSGKYYSEGTYQTECPYMFRVFEEVEEMLHSGHWPGLAPNSLHYFITLVECPTLEDAYPGIIMPIPQREDK